MTLEQIKDQIRNLTPRARMELYRWLDRSMAPHFCSSDFCYRIGLDRSLEIGSKIEEESKMASLGRFSAPGKNPPGDPSPSLKPYEKLI
jgi:hypothetical protein